MNDKIMIAVWAGDLTPLTGAGFRETCAKAGARRLQVNVSDAAVEGAMRISHLDPPIDAVVSLWFDDASARAVGLPSVVAGLGEFAGRLAGWAVTERAPLDPELPQDFTRVEALSNLAFLRRPADLSYDEWKRIWHDDHTGVAIETQATFGYYQNVVDAPLVVDGAGLDELDPPVSGIVEELFPPAAVSDAHAFYGSNGDQAELENRLTRMIASVERFGAGRDLDVVPTSRYDITYS